MRQAGRYLPEYRALRSKYDMLSMCRTPELAAQVSLQPLERFDLDAAILFSDIMIPLQGMGIDFTIQESVGPVVANPVRTRADADKLRVVDPERDVPFVAETVRLLSHELKDRVPLIGFAGGPFTLASYVVEGKPSRDLSRTKQLMYREPDAWKTMMDKLAASVGRYLAAQIDAGAQVVQVFDSWVGALAPRDYRTYVFPYTKRVFDSLATRGVPRIHFGTGTATIIELMQAAGGDVIGIDWRLPIDQARLRLGNAAVQGNLDPAILLSDPGTVQERAHAILEQADGKPGHIFNLGHGILPHTPIDNVTKLVEAVHNYPGHSA